MICLTSSGGYGCTSQYLKRPHPCLKHDRLQYNSVRSIYPFCCWKGETAGTSDSIRKKRAILKGILGSIFNWRCLGHRVLIPTNRALEILKGQFKLISLGNDLGAVIDHDHHGGPTSEPSTSWLTILFHFFFTFSFVCKRSDYVVPHRFLHIIRHWLSISLDNSGQSAMDCGSFKEAVE